MRKDFGVKPWIYPQPVLIIATYGKDGTPDAMNAAWGCMGESNKIFVCLDSGHQTTANILERKAFTVSMGEGAQAVACDYVGLVSGKDVPDKMEKAGFHTTKSAFVDAPLIDELALALECRLESYDPETCRLIGEIVNISIDDRVLTEDGKIDIKKLDPIALDPANGVYYSMGEKAAQAFCDGNKLK